MKRLTTFILGAVLAMTLQGCATSGWYHLPTLDFDQVDYVLPTTTVQVRNIDVACIDQGSGDTTLLLIHGLGSNAKAWLRNIPAWARDCRVIAVDLPGYGKSDKGYYDYSLDFYAQVLTELLDALDIERAVWVGHSLGAQIAMVAALEYPERVQKLVLISPAGFERFDEGEGAWMKKVMTPELVRDTTIRQIDINLRSNFYRTPPEADFMITDRIQIRGAPDFERYCYAVSRNVAAMIDHPVWEQLPDIAQPALVLFGENDQLIPNRFLHGGWTSRVAEEGTAALPNARLVLVPECGHFVQFEKPERTNAVVLEFLRES